MEEKPFPWRWPAGGCLVVALLGPTLALEASQRWGALVAAGVVLLEGAALTLITALAIRRREAWLRARYGSERLEARARVSWR